MLRKELEDKVALQVLEGRFLDGDVVHVDADGDHLRITTAGPSLDKTPEEPEAFTA